MPDEMLTNEHRRRRSPAKTPCEVCGKMVTVSGAGRMQHMKTHTRLTAPDDAARRRFESKFAVLPNGCWQWNRFTQKCPYGCFYFAGRKYMPFMFAWWIYRGQLVKSPPLELDHLCKNKSCVNPDHLEPVTRSVNAIRAKAATHCPKGHEFTDENLIYSTTRNGARQRLCRKCQALSHKAYYAANREQLDRKNLEARHRRKARLQNHVI